MMELKTGEIKTPPERVVRKKSENPSPKEGSSALGMVDITFRDNRKYDLHIGRKIITFLARETKKIDSSLLNHPDWKQAEKLFVISPKGE